MIFNSLRAALVISGVIAFFYYGSGIKEDDHPVVFFTVTLIISFALMYVVERAKEKKDTTCPRCKTPFSYYDELIKTETLSEDYISQDVKDSNGVYRRKAFRVGKEKDYYRTTCKECGYTTERAEVSSFKREVE